MKPIQPKDEPEDPIEVALLEYSMAWFRGDFLDPDRFCRSRPECGPELRSRIDDFIFVARGFGTQTDLPSDDSSSEAFS